MTTPPRPLRLRRVRWLARAALGLGVFVSVAANVLHAPPDPISRVIAAWPPLALLLTVELISRVPVDRPALAVARRAVTAGIAAIAAWMSYWHMVAVVGRYGENGASAYLWPLSVDGLVVVASISLVEIAGRMPKPAQVRAVSPPVAAVGRMDAGATGTASEATGSATATVHSTVGLSGTAAMVARWRSEHPTASASEIAAHVGRSTRQVRRILADLTSPDQVPG